MSKKIIEQNRKRLEDIIKNRIEEQETKYITRFILIGLTKAWCYWSDNREQIWVLHSTCKELPDKLSGIPLPDGENERNCRICKRRMSDKTMTKALTLFKLNETIK